MADISDITNAYRTKYLKYKKKYNSLSKKQTGGEASHIDGNRKLIDYSNIKDALRLKTHATRSINIDTYTYTYTDTYTDTGIGTYTGIGIGTGTQAQDGGNIAKGTRKLNSYENKNDKSAKKCCTCCNPCTCNPCQCNK